MRTKYHPDHPPSFWAAVRIDYETTILSSRAIGRRHGVSYGAIKKHAVADGWVRPEKSAEAAAGNNLPVGKRTPREILEAIAEDGLSPAAARVAACKILLGIEKQSDEMKAAEKHDCITTRALELIKGGRQ